MTALFCSKSLDSGLMSGHFEVLGPRLPFLVGDLGAAIERGRTSLNLTETVYEVVLKISFLA